jgi:hypothetical protein
MLFTDRLKGGISASDMCRGTFLEVPSRPVSFRTPHYASCIHTLGGNTENKEKKQQPRVHESCPSDMKNML